MTRQPTGIAIPGRVIFMPRLRPRIVPLPRISLIAPQISIITPMPVPAAVASLTAVRTSFLTAKVSQCTAVAELTATRGRMIFIISDKLISVLNSISQSTGQIIARPIIRYKATLTNLGTFLSAVLAMKAVMIRSANIATAVKKSSSRFCVAATTGQRATH